MEETKKAMIDGFNVRISKSAGGDWVATVNELPGVLAIAKEESQIIPETRRLIRVQLLELITRMPTIFKYMNLRKREEQSDNARRQPRNKGDHSHLRLVKKT